MTIKKWLRNLDKCSRSIKSCLHVWCISWVVLYGYNVVNMTRMLILGFMHRFNIKLMYGGQKWAL